MFTRFIKLSLLTTIVMLFALSLSAESLPDYISDYNCARNIVAQSIQSDSDADSVYDSYSITLCGQIDSQTYPIYAIGDIRKWPPLDIPTRSIAADLNGESLSFVETYLDFNGNVLGWFQKFENVDTVYFHGGDTFNTTDFMVDSSAYFLQIFPNPASDVMNIHYVVKSSGRISIQFLTYEGELLSNVVNIPSPKGEFNMVFNVSQYVEGYYKLRYTNGSNVYTISVAIVR